MIIHWKVLPQGYKLRKEVLRNLGKHFKLAVEVLFLQLLQCCEDMNGEHIQGRVWGWQDWEKCKYFQLNIATSFSDVKLPICWAKLNRKGVVLSRRPQGKRVTCAISSTDCERWRGRGYFTDLTCTNQITAMTDKKYAASQCSQSTGQGSCSACGTWEALHQGPAVNSWAESWLLNPAARISWGFLIPLGMKLSIFWRQALHSLEPTNPQILKWLQFSNRSSFINFLYTDHFLSTNE